jgi:hypothetical protein
MQNSIDASITAANRDQMLALIAQISDLMPVKIDLSPEDRKSLVKMGESGRPFVESTLNIVEQNDSFMPRSFDKTVMRKDSDFYTMMLPVWIQVIKPSEMFDDTMMLTGNDLIMAGLEVYKNLKNNGEGENLDNLVPLVGRRFKQTAKKDNGDDNDNDGEDPKP